MSPITYGFEFEYQTGSYGRLPPGVEYHNDSSVRGGELVTVGGHSMEVALAKFEAILAAGKFGVDAGCSFHIHVKSPEITRLRNEGDQHIYQAEASLFLLLHFDKWPKRVQKRFFLKRNFFHYSFDRDKFRSIRVHPQGTMEYRLWGNVASLEDARRCMELTEAAHVHALQAISGDGPAMLSRHMQAYVKAGSKGIEWLLQRDHRTEFNWQKLEEGIRKWSAKVLKEITDRERAKAGGHSIGNVG